MGSVGVLFVLVIAVIVFVWVTDDVYATTGCPAGWIPWTGSCYLGLDGSLTGSWYAAVQRCADKEGYMVVPSTEKENSFLNASFRDTQNSVILENNFIGFWIGCTDAQDEGVWMCSEGDNITVSYRNWEPDQPDGGTKGYPDQDGAFVVTRDYKKGSSIIGYWGDQRSYHDYMYIVCERPRDDECGGPRPTSASPVFCIPLEGGDGRPLLGRCLVGHVFAKHPTVGASACARRCAEHPSCQSFNLRSAGQGTDGAVCELNSARRDEIATVFIETVGCTHFLISCR